MEEQTTKRIEYQVYAIKKVTTRWLIGIVIFLHVANVFVVVFRHSRIDFFLKDFFIKLFQVNNEGKVPTWYSACALLFCALLLIVIIYLKRQNRAPHLFHWIGLAVLFTLMSLDEAACIHEMTTVPLRSALNTNGLFYHAWVIPGIIFVLIFGIIYLNFILNLPSRTRYLFIIAGFVYLSGVLGMELVGGAYSYYYAHNLTYSILATIEEILEMSGIVVFIYSLLDYIEGHLKSRKRNFVFIKKIESRH